jgi:DNA-directed RNA polymerase subunit omega
MDIVSLPIEHEKDKIDSRFRLVVIASQRAKELALGANVKTESKHKKYPTLAIEEALEGELEFITGEEARVANEEARKFDYNRFLEEKRRESMPEDISELEKDLRVYLTEREDAETVALEELFGDKDKENSEDKAEE